MCYGFDDAKGSGKGFEKRESLSADREKAKKDDERPVPDETIEAEDPFEALSKVKKLFEEEEV